MQLPCVVLYSGYVVYTLWFVRRVSQPTCRQRFLYKATAVPILSPRLSCKQYKMNSNYKVFNNKTSKQQKIHKTATTDKWFIYYRVTIFYFAWTDAITPNTFKHNVHLDNTSLEDLGTHRVYKFQRKILCIVSRQMNVTVYIWYP